jgi:hypothetical protein
MHRLSGFVGAHCSLVQVEVEAYGRCFDNQQKRELLDRMMYIPFKACDPCRPILRSHCVQHASAFSSSVCVHPSHQRSDALCCPGMISPLCVIALLCRQGKVNMSAPEVTFVLCYVDVRATQGEFQLDEVRGVGKGRGSDILRYNPFTGLSCMPSVIECSAVSSHISSRGCTARSCDPAGPGVPRITTRLAYHLMLPTDRVLLPVLWAAGGAVQPHRGQPVHPQPAALHWTYK